MSGMLSGGLNPQMLAQLLGQTRSDPFSKPMPGSALLGDGPMPGMPQMQQPQAPQQMPGMPGMPGMPQQPGMGGPQIPGMETANTSFADTQPGLPNLPESFKGFGFGQFAPETHQADPIRQQLIQQLMQMMPQMGSGIQNGGGF